MTLLGQVAERTNVKLGVLLPLMHNDPPTAAKEIASDVNDGIVFAAGTVHASARTADEDPVADL